MSQASDLEREMLDLINAERLALGLNPVQLELQLNASAEDHSTWMLNTDTFSHTGVNNSSATQRIRDSGFDLTGSWRTAENIAWQSQRGAAGFSDDVVDLHNSLMASPGHRANILDPNLTYIGIGIEIGTFNGVPAVMVTQNFAHTSAPVQLDTGGTSTGGGGGSTPGTPPAPPAPNPITVIDVPGDGSGQGPTASTETFDFGNAAGTLSGTPGELNGDLLQGFDHSNTLVLEGVAPGRSNIRFNQNSEIQVDTDGDGDYDVTISLNAGLPNGDIFAVAKGGDTVITYADYLPGLSDGMQVGRDQVNGIVNKDYLAGDGSTDFQIQMLDIGFAGFDNVVGVYEIDSNGEISNVQLIYTNANDVNGLVNLQDVTDGNRLGFFIVQDAAEWAEALSGSDVLDFQASNGAVADVDDGLDLLLTVNGEVANVTTFHAENALLNTDNEQHALSGIAPGGDAMIVGFEDLLGGGDYDFEDVVFSVTRIESDALSVV
ncbi:CAP domain-containing protein [Ruegeria sp.]|uniref:CAP domain-containing protein n=1 Tax=Ruegeria sp. TaxID=1879320 RepID=UPI003B5A3533